MGKSIKVCQLFNSSANINPMEKGEWNSSRIVKDAVILKENSVRPDGSYQRWIRREIRTVKERKKHGGKKRQKLEEKWKSSHPFSSLYIPGCLAFSNYPDGQLRCSPVIGLFGIPYTVGYKLFFRKGKLKLNHS